MYVGEKFKYRYVMINVWRRYKISLVILVKELLFYDICVNL